jgi:hypothetical protein
MRNPVVFWLAFIFSLVNVIDVATAMFILHGESNPIYFLTGSRALLWFGKLFVILLVWMLYLINKQKSDWWHYLVLSVLVYGTIVMSIGAASNIYGMLHPTDTVNVASMKTKDVVDYYTFFVLLFYILPLAFNLLTFKLYEHSKKYMIILKKEKVMVTINNLLTDIKKLFVR